MDEKHVETKVCPRCGEELFSDMDICYGCLYDFSNPPNSVVGAAMPASDGERGRIEGDVTEEADPSVEGELDATLPLDVPQDTIGRGTGGLWVRTSDMETKVDVPPGGLVVGRAPDCDVILHSIAVSRRHVSFCPGQGCLEVRNLGAKNPATIGGREITDTFKMKRGQTVSVCGTLFTYVGERR
ncbi:MAG: FHA domain-containing protein [Parafannyhessea sp.]|uniref:FHA domain-containing protein n=1 Tax=Parafannyhessea sp. TaxID=2847324 RepID=UPI003EFEB89A